MARQYVVEVGVSAVVGELTHRRKDRIENGEDRSAVHQFLGIASEPNATGDEGLLGIQHVRCHCDGGLPVLFEADVLRIGWTGAETRLTICDLKVIRDVAFWSSENGLRDSDGVMPCDIGHLGRVGDGFGQRIDPIETEIAHSRR